MVHLARASVTVAETAHATAAAVHLGRLGGDDHAHVWQAPKLALQHLVGAQPRVVFDQRDLRDDAGEIDGRLDPRVSAADHGDPLALEQRAVAVRAVRDAAPAILALAWNVHLPPACTGRQYQAAAAQAGAVREFHGQQPCGVRRLQRDGALRLHDVDLVTADVILQRRRELRALGVRDRYEILDAERVEQLPPETLCHDAGTHALSRRIDRGGCAGRASAHDQHVEGILGVDLLGALRARILVQPGQDLRDAHPTLAERLAVQVDRGHRQDLPLFDLRLEQRAVDHRAADPWVPHRHQVQRLDDLRAVLAAERNVDLELEILVDGLDLLDGGGLRLRRMPAGLQQRQHQRRELVTHRQSREADAHLRASAAHAERRHAHRAVRLTLLERDQAGQRCDLAQQIVHLPRRVAVVQRRDDLYGSGQALQVSLQLLLQRGVEHLAVTPWLCGEGRPPRPSDPDGAGGAQRTRLRSCRPGRAKGRASSRLASTWPGRPRPGARRCTVPPAPCAAAPARRGRCRGR